MLLPPLMWDWYGFSWLPRELGQAGRRCQVAKIRLKFRHGLASPNGQRSIRQLEISPTLRLASTSEQELPLASLLQIPTPHPAPSWHLAGLHLHLCSSLISDC